MDVLLFLRDGLLPALLQSLDLIVLLVHFVHQFSEFGLDALDAQGVQLPLSVLLLDQNLKVSQLLLQRLVDVGQFSQPSLVLVD